MTTEDELLRFSAEAPTRAEVEAFCKARTVGLVVAALMAAAAVVLFVRPPREGDDAPPSYAAAITSADHAARSEAAGAGAAEEVQSSEAFELVARPAHPTRDAIEARAYLDEGGALRPWPPARAEVSSDGAVRIAGPTAALFPRGEGDYAIVVLIGPSPLPAEDAATLQRRADVRTVRARVHVGRAVR